MNNKPSKNWNEIEKSLNITPEQEAEIQLEMDVIRAIIETRESQRLTQRDLSKRSGVKQPAIARIEKGINSSQIRTIIKLLYPMGYTLRVVPIKDK